MWDLMDPRWCSIRLDHGFLNGGPPC
jgi:hypothetical protein